MKNFNWVKKSSNRTQSGADVSLTCVKGHEGMATHITFRNNIFLRISKTDHFVFAVDGNRIYFNEASKREGYKAYNKKNLNNRYVKVSTNLPEFIGDYKLEWDSKEGLNYIDISKRIQY